MGKRINHDAAFYEPPVKKSLIAPHSNVSISSGTILTDISGQKWKLGKSIGNGGFGMIYLVSDNIHKDVDNQAPYVAKIEAHKSGPLFVERNCYLQIAKQEMVEDWKTKNSLRHLGMPYYVASGSHTAGENKYRFLIIPRFNKDLDAVFEAKKCKFNLKTVLTIALQTLDVLEYIHSKGYVHSDIKASNILLEMKKTLKPHFPISPRNKQFKYCGCMPIRLCKVKKLNTCRVLRPNPNLHYVENIEEQKTTLKHDIDKIYLLDYGLASKYLTMQGKHKEFCTDNRRAHAGTILFCSRDAHEGAQSRRSDLECLGYNLIYWLTSQLPWSGDTENPDMVYKKKKKCINQLKNFLDYSFNYQCPKFLFDYFNYLKSLSFEQNPDYKHCKYLFKKALKEYGYKDNLLLDFDNLEGWGRKQKQIKLNLENRELQYTLLKFKRIPLKSNLPIKLTQPIRHVLRKNGNKKFRNMRWSKLLHLDPENIIKQANAREKKLSDSFENNGCVSHLDTIEDLNELNPTLAMRDIFNKYKGRHSNGNLTFPRYKNERTFPTFEGYTPAMMEVYTRMKEREEMEYNATIKLCNTRKRNNHAKKNNNIKAASSKVKKQKKEISSPPCTRSTKRLKDLKKIKSSRIYCRKG